MRMIKVIVILALLVITAPYTVGIVGFLAGMISGLSGF
jgi:hypothetical protein